VDAVDTDRFPANIRDQVDTVVNNLGSNLASTLTGVLPSVQSMASQVLSSLGVVFGFAAIPLLPNIYLLKDSDKNPAKYL